MKKNQKFLQNRGGTGEVTAIGRSCERGGSQKKLAMTNNQSEKKGARGVGKGLSQTPKEGKRHERAREISQGKHRRSRRTTGTREDQLDKNKKINHSKLYTRCSVRIAKREGRAWGDGLWLQ